MQVLGISENAALTDIKRAYRDLGKKHHPDVGGDPDKFQSIAKAYETLTDPEALENWKRYNNPDGKQALELSIGLPTWLLEGVTGTAFLAGYMVLLLVVVPVLMYRGYNKNKGIDVGTGLQIPTMHWISNFMRAHAMSVQTMPEFIGGCPEFLKLPSAPGDAEIIDQYAVGLAKEGAWRNLQPQIRWMFDPQFVRRVVVLLLAHANKGKRSLAQAFSSPTIADATNEILKKLNKIIDITIQSGVEIEQYTEMMYRRSRDPRKAQLPYRFIEGAAEIAKFSQYVCTCYVLSR
jgi:hypothetical protein